MGQAAPGEGTRDLFFPRAQSAPFPQGMIACSGWYRSVLTYCSASPPLLDVGESLFIPTAFFPEATIIFLLQLPLFAKYRELLGEEGGIGHISKYPVVKIGAQGRKDHVSVVCPSYKWRMHLNCGFENKIGRE